MKKTTKIRISTSITVALIILLASPQLVFSENQVPEKIRVGLFYSDSSIGASSAQESISVNSPSGLSIGFSGSGVYTEIYNEATTSSFVVKKDEGFHIKIGSDYPDFATASAMLQALKGSGLKAYIAYSDSWQIWIGTYLEAAAALQDITTTFAPSLGEGVCTVLEPAAGRIAVENSVNEKVAVFYSASAYFQVKSAAITDLMLVYLNGKPYRGAIEVRRLAGSDLTVINVISITEYLYGSVPPEIGGGSHPEALKAQAVAAKMYVLNNLGKHGKTGFDVCSTTNCQVYKGYSAEVAACNAAIDEVKDKLVTYQGLPAKQIFYYASSAGITEDSVNVWGYSHPYLKSVVDSYEPIFNWTKLVKASDIKAKLPALGNILGMKVTKQAPSGRVTELTIRGDSGSNSVLYKLERARTVFSLNSQMYSISTDADVHVGRSDATSELAQLGGMFVTGASATKVLTSLTNKINMLGAAGVTKTASLVPETYLFTGKGWGHAVGLSQEGARAMGNAGFKYDEILKYYFQGTEVQ